MVGRDVDIYAELMNCACDRVVPQSHAAIAENESTTVSERTVVVGNRKPGDRRSGAGEYRNADGSGGRPRRQPATDDAGGGSNSGRTGAFGIFVPDQQHTRWDDDRKDFVVAVSAGSNMNRCAAPYGHAHRVSEPLELRVLCPGIPIRAVRSDHPVNRGLVVFLVLFKRAGGKRKRRQNDNGNPAVRGCAHGVLPPLCVAANLPTSCIAVKGTMPRKSKNLPPSGIFSRQSKNSTPSANFRQFVTLPAWRSISWINSKGAVYHECYDRCTFPCDVGLKRAIESSSPENATRADLRPSRRRSR